MGALSARRGAINRNTSQLFRAGALAMMMTLLALLVSSCDKDSRSQIAQLKKNSADSVMKPKIDIKVNRRFDEKGNMIGFDSTYTSYYSNMSGDTAGMDSLMGSFDRYFKKDHPLFFKNQFDPLFFNDSTRYPDFFHNDYFMRRYELNDQYMRGMMQQMDSIKNKFYREHRRVDNKPKT
ncbi:hypothetical protein DQQ10_00350 [Pseudochryseolinea flava]|uniref:Uncharacterized protein n=2 Tax=Pseudochryseolinea flava TaxID=2059302 RepID=A0A364Y8N8_9BACT|nr:hypothetical protein DQQ10_00350 [Pseudochryseolinea flava]